jgi:hypothetical protein
LGDFLVERLQFLAERLAFLPEPMLFGLMLLDLLVALRQFGPKRLVGGTLDIKLSTDLIDVLAERGDLGGVGCRGGAYDPSFGSRGSGFIGRSDYKGLTAVLAGHRLADIFAPDVQGVLAMRACSLEVRGRHGMGSAESTTGLNACRV